MLWSTRLFYEIYKRLLVYCSDSVDEYFLDSADSETSDRVDQRSVFSDKSLEFSSQDFNLRVLNGNLDVSSCTRVSELRFLEQSVSVLINYTVSALKFTDSALQLEVFFFNSTESGG